MSEQFPLNELVACAERELGKRQKFYPNWVRDGRMKDSDAQSEIAKMEAIVETLKKLKQPNLL